MSADHDRTFFDTFMLVLGLLILVTIGLIFLARNIAHETADVAHQQDPVRQAEVMRNIAPVARVAVAGQDNAALSPPAAEPAAAAAPVADLAGEEVYKQVCTMCHEAAVAGAPKTGDKAVWAPRIAQGTDTMYKHALEGFQGKAGYMPPKGGRADLSDQSIRNGVDYLVSRAQ